MFYSRRSDFHVPGDDAVEVERHLGIFVSGQSHDDLLSIHMTRIVGGQISSFFIHPRGVPLNRLEGQLSADLVHSWIDSIERSCLKPFQHLPKFELSQSVDITDLLHLQHPLKSSTELAIDDVGINSPELLELQFDFDGIGHIGNVGIPEQYRAERWNGTCSQSLDITYTKQ